MNHIDCVYYKSCCKDGTAMERYRFTTEQQKLLEGLRQPFAVYQFIDRKVVTIVLSDGLCKLFGYEDRAKACYDMDHDMYKDTHPDDRKRISDAALRFAAGGEDYEVVFRTSAGVESDYRVIHAHGKHVYTEKTLTDDPAAAEELLKLAQEKGLQLGSAPDTFLGSSLQTARKAVDSGMLGDIHSFAVSSTRCNDYFASRYPFLREPGCGLLYDYAVYYVTALVSLLGPAAMVCGTVENPYSVRKNIFRDSPDFGKSFSSPNESQVCALMRMKSGVMGTFT